MNVSARDSPFLLTGNASTRYASEDIPGAERLKMFSFVDFPRGSASRNHRESGLPVSS